MQIAHHIATTLLLALPPGAALADAGEAESGNTQLAAAAGEVVQSCGVEIAVSYDWASEKASPGKPGYQGPIYCKSVVDAARSACTDAEAKAVIAGAIKSIRCRFAAGASAHKDLGSGGGPVLELAGTTLSATYDWSSFNLESETYAWLTKKLRTPWPNGMATVEERKEKKEGEEQLAAAITELNEACGATFAVTYDWSSEKSAPADPAWQGFLYCKNILGGLRNACGDAETKTALAANVKQIRCRFEAGASKSKELDAYGGPVMKHAGDVLSATYEWASANLESQTSKWAGKKMLIPGDNGPVTVEAKKERDRGQEELAAAGEALNATCGTTITTSYDFASEKKAAAKPAWQGYLYCKEVLEGLTQACGDPRRRASLAKKVKRIHCAFATGASKSKKLDAMGGAILKFEGKKLRVTYDWNTGNIATQTARWAEKKL